MKKLILPFAFLLISFSASSQSVQVEGLPSDLNEKIVIFPILTSASLSEGKPADRKEREVLRVKETYNKYLPKSNSELEKTMKDYPFNCVSAKDDELKQLIEEKEGYLFYFEPFYSLKEGKMSSGSNTYDKYPAKLIDLESGTEYILYYEGENNAYRYGELVKRLTKAVKKKYK